MSKTIASSWDQNGSLTDLTTGRIILGDALPATWLPRNHLTYSRAGQICGCIEWPNGVVSTSSPEVLMQHHVNYDDGRGFGSLADPTREHGGDREIEISAFGRDFTITATLRELGGATTSTVLVTESTGSERWVSNTVNVPAGAWLIDMTVERPASTDGIVRQVAWRELVLEEADL